MLILEASKWRALEKPGWHEGVRVEGAPHTVQPLLAPRRGWRMRREAGGSLAMSSRPQHCVQSHINGRPEEEGRLSPGPGRLLVCGPREDARSAAGRPAGCGLSAQCPGRVAGEAGPSAGGGSPALARAWGHMSPRAFVVSGLPWRPPDHRGCRRLGWGWRDGPSPASPPSAHGVLVRPRRGLGGEGLCAGEGHEERRGGRGDADVPEHPEDAGFPAQVGVAGGHGWVAGPPSPPSAPGSAVSSTLCRVSGSWAPAGGHPGWDSCLLQRDWHSLCPPPPPRPLGSLAAAPVSRRGRFFAQGPHEWLLKVGPCI